MRTALNTEHDTSTRSPAHNDGRMKEFCITMRKLTAGVLTLGLLFVAIGCSESPVEGNPNPDPIPEPEFEAPASPSALTAESRTGQVALTWGESEDADGYFVYRATSPIESLPDTPFSERVSGTSFLDNEVSNGVTYYYQVTATAPDGETESGPSNEAAATPFAAPPERP